MTKKKRIAALEKQVADLQGEVASLQSQLIKLALQPYTAPQPLPMVTPTWNDPPSWWREPITSDAARKPEWTYGDPLGTVATGKTQ